MFAIHMLYQECYKNNLKLMLMFEIDHANASSSSGLLTVGWSLKANLISLWTFLISTFNQHSM